MLKNYLNIALRHLWKSKLYSFINITGLSVGITCLLLALLYWKDERSFDTFHANNPNLYRITTTLAESRNDVIHTTGGTGQVQGPAFKAGVPEVKDFVRVMGGGIYGDIIANEKALHLNLLFADPVFFNVFSFDFVRGNSASALRDINSAVITEQTALKFFNSIDVIGKTLQPDADPSAKRLGKPMTITGVVKDLPSKSSIQFDVLMPFSFMQLSFDDRTWLNAYLGTFVVMQPNIDVKKVIQKFNSIYAAQAKEQLAENIKTYGYDPTISYGLQPMTDIHLNPLQMSMESGVANGSNPFFSYMFMGIAIFILLMAGINFINISLADSLKRAKEVGIRKITGGNRYQIIMQFIGESAILCLAAFITAVILTYVSLPVFNELTGKDILLGDVFTPQLIVACIALLVVVIFLTGLYPAFILSNFKPVAVLYKKQKLSGNNIFGKSLVIVQFSLAVLLLIATVIYYRQMDFVRTKDLGYNPHQVIITNIPGDRERKPVESFLQHELSKEPSVKIISFGADFGGTSEVKLKDRIIKAAYTVIDENYLAALQIPLKAGRNFSSAFPGDINQAVIVNEAFVKAALLENPLGTIIETDRNYSDQPRVITGVVKDFHTGSLRESIQPTIMLMNDVYGGKILIRFEKARQREAMAAIEKAFKKAIPQAVYQYSFLDELNAKSYIQEHRWQKIIGIATVLSVIICCLGLFGLSHLAAHQRLKEVGIRKVLGASVAGIAGLLSKDFLQLVCLAILIASPVAWYVMNKWLQNFAYRIQISWWIFVLAGCIAIIIALVTVSFQAVKTALANPVTALKNE